MASVDDRVVSMEFDNKQFTTAVTATMSLLDKLKASLTFSGNKNGLDDVQASANKFSLAGVTDQVAGATKSFSALSIAGVAALATIVSKAVDAGIQFTKAFTLDPIKAGFSNYETQINAVQTILANTGLTGADGLAQVNNALQGLNTYANQTVYNFSQMAASIGTFTAAGVKLDPAVAAIKGIANLAAASGASADQASGAMYQLSQALAAGTFKLQDYNSVVNAGIGGKLFQEAIYNAAVAAKTLKTTKLGETYDEWTAAGNNFRQSLQDGYVTTTVLSNALASFTGDQTAEQLKAQGYNDAQIAHIQQTARLAVDAATQIKTFTQLTSALKEEVATAYGAVFKTIFGDINGATALFSKLHTSIENALTAPIYAFNNLLIAASALGARTNVIQGFSNVIKALGGILKPIAEAFRQIFPATTAKTINSLTVGFAAFTAKLIPAQTTIDGIRRTFVGLFAALDIAKTILGDVAHLVVVFLGSFSGNGGLGGIFKVTASISDFLVKLDEMVKHGEGVRDFFTTLGDKITIPAVLLKQLSDVIGGLFTKFQKKDGDALNASVSTLGATLEGLASGFDKVTTAISNFVKPLAQELKPALDAAINLFATLGDNIANAINTGDFSGVLRVLQTGLLAGIFLTIKKFLDKGITISPTGGIVDKVKESLDGLTGTLKSMQLQLKAKALEEIAIAIGILTASVVALSLINASNLQKSLQAMAVGFGELLGALAILTKISSAGGVAKLPVMAASLVVLSTAILILTGAVAILGNLKYETLQKGLGAVVLLLGTLTGVAVTLSKNSGGLVAAGIGITAISVAMVILSGAVALFGNMDLPTLGKGIGAVTLLLGVLVGAAILLSKNVEGLIAASVGLTAIAVALNILAGAIVILGHMDLISLGKGLGAIAAVLLILAGTLHLMPSGGELAAQGAGLVLVAFALELIVGVIATLSTISYASLAKGIGSLAVILLVLAIALKNMESNLKGAATLDLVTVALIGLSGVIKLFSTMSWGALAKGIGVMAIALGVLIAAGYAADGASLGLFAIAAAALALGGAVALVGVGIGAMAAGLGELVKLGGAGISILIQAIAGVISQIPALAVAFAEGLINILKIIGENGPAILQAFGTIIGSLLDAVIQNIPKLAALIETLIGAIVAIILKDVPLILAAAITLIEALLTGITSALPKIVGEVATLIVTLLGALASHIPEIVQAGVDVLVAILTGIANAVPQIVGAVANIITTLIGAIAGSEGQIITAGANAIIALITGLGQNVGRIIAAGATAIINFVNGLASNAVAIANAAGQAILNFLNGLDTAINKYEPQIISAAAKIGADIIKGIINGLGDIGGQIASKIKDGATGAISKGVSFVTGLVGSPYKIGKIIADGMVEGVADNVDGLTTAVQKNITQAISDVGKKLGQANLTGIELNPTITPVLDLTNIQKDATKINGYLAATPLSIDTTVNSAESVASMQLAQDAYRADQADAVATQAGDIIFNQTNTSPEALSASQIYRNTKSQLSLAKGALAL